MFCCQPHPQHYSAELLCWYSCQPFQTRSMPAAPLDNTQTIGEYLLYNYTWNYVNHPFNRSILPSTNRFSLWKWFLDNRRRPGEQILHARPISFILHTGKKKKLFILNLKNLQQKSSSFKQDVKMGHKILFFSYGEDGFQYYTPTFEGDTQLELTFSRRAAPRCPQKTKTETEKPC